MRPKLLKCYWCPNTVSVPAEIERVICQTCTSGGASFLSDPKADLSLRTLTTKTAKQAATQGISIEDLGGD